MIVPELHVETIHQWSVDTVTTYVDRVRIRTKVDTVARTVYVDVVCPHDTVYVEHTYDRTIIQPRVKPKRDPWDGLKFLFGIVIIVAIAVWLLRYSENRRE